MSCEDSVAARGMRILYSPLAGDGRVVSGESGAVTMGALYALCTEKELQEVRDIVGLTRDSRVLLVSTEGDTDPQGFFRNVWA